MIKDMRKIVEVGYEKGSYADKFRKIDKPNEIENRFLRLLISHLPKNPSVLDFGSGIGIPFDNYLSKHGCKITGVDISQKHIKQAQKNVPKARYIKGGFSQIKFQELFDAIVSFYAIFHIPKEEHSELFRKMVKLLKKGGLILVTLGTSGTDGIEKDWCGAKMAWSTYDPKIYRKIVLEAGFEIIEEAFEGKPGDDEYHFWVLARKKY